MARLTLLLLCTGQGNPTALGLGRLGLSWEGKRQRAGNWVSRDYLRPNPRRERETTPNVEDPPGGRVVREFPKLSLIVLSRKREGSETRSVASRAVG